MSSSVEVPVVAAARRVAGNEAELEVFARAEA
jgi:hypothetical protein